MTLLLDTHTCLWFWWDDPQLGPTARDAICDPANRKLVSTASCWEIAIKTSLKKLDLGAPYRGFVHQQMVRNNFELLQITDEHLSELAELPFHHRDPFDRLLIAQAMIENVPLVSRDEEFDQYPIRRVW